MTSDNDSKQTLLENALHHLRSAIELLDLAAAPGQIAAHVDLAANQLEELLPRVLPGTFRPVNENGEGCGTVSPF